MPAPKTDADDLSLYSRLGPPIAASPEITVCDDPLLARLLRFHGADVRREHDDLTVQLASGAVKKCV